MNNRAIYEIRARLAEDLRAAGRTFAEIVLILRLNGKEAARQLVGRGARRKRERDEANVSGGGI